MRKIMLLGILLLSSGMTHAASTDTILGQFYLGFVDNAKFAIESRTNGTTSGEFLDNFIEIGKIRNEHIAAIDAGITGEFLPENNQFEAADWSVGAKIHIAPIFKNYVHLPEQWQFLNNLEIDGRYSYDFTRHHPYLGICAAYPFR